jgi:hypothetical protein
MIQTPRRKIPEESNMETEGRGKEWALSSDKERPCPHRCKHGGRSEVVHHVTGKLFPQGHDAKHCFPS